MPICVWQEGICKFAYSLSFNATPSNNVEMAFGRDSDKDGLLSEEIV